MNSQNPFAPFQDLLDAFNVGPLNLAPLILEEQSRYLNQRFDQDPNFENPDLLNFKEKETLTFESQEFKSIKTGSFDFNKSFLPNIFLNNTKVDLPLVLRLKDQDRVFGIMGYLGLNHSNSNINQIKFLLEPKKLTNFSNMFKKDDSKNNLRLILSSSIKTRVLDMFNVKDLVKGLCLENDLGSEVSWLLIDNDLFMSLFKELKDLIPDLRFCINDNEVNTSIQNIEIDSEFKRFLMNILLSRNFGFYQTRTSQKVNIVNVMEYTIQEKILDSKTWVCVNHDQMRILGYFQEFELDPDLNNCVIEIENTYHDQKIISRHHISKKFNQVILGPGHNNSLTQITALGLSLNSFNTHDHFFNLQIQNIQETWSRTLNRNIPVKDDSPELKRCFICLGDFLTTFMIKDNHNHKEYSCFPCLIQTLKQSNKCGVCRQSLTWPCPNYFGPKSLEINLTKLPEIPSNELYIVRLHKLETTSFLDSEILRQGQELSWTRKFDSELDLNVRMYFEKDLNTFPMEEYKKDFIRIRLYELDNPRQKHLITKLIRSSKFKFEFQVNSETNNIDLIMSEPKDTYLWVGLDFDFEPGQSRLKNMIIYMVLRSDYFHRLQDIKDSIYHVVRMSLISYMIESFRLQTWSALNLGPVMSKGIDNVFDWVLTLDQVWETILKNEKEKK